MRIYTKLSIFLLVALVLECLSAPLVKSGEMQTTEGDIIIIGNTSDKQLEMEGYWTRDGKKGGTISSSSQSNEDEDISRYCRNDGRSAYPVYSRYSECIKIESKAKNLLLSTGIQNTANGSYRTGCFYQNTGYNSSTPTPWSYRYICIRNAVERQKRKQQYMDNY